MPNHPVVVSGAIIVVSVAVAAAIAVYESPQARQFAEDVRRRIALALHSLGDEINPNAQQPRFNRPEDAEGFMQSTGEAGVDADEESRRRQREELMYWNAVHMEKLEKERLMNEKEKTPSSNKSRSSSFEDFLHQDPTAEKGTFVYNTGADVNQRTEEGLVHRRGVRGLDRSKIYANPFADEHGIDSEEQQEQTAMDKSLMSPEVDEKSEADSEGLYSCHDYPVRSRHSTETVAAAEPIPHEETETLVDVSEPSSESTADPPISIPSYEAMQAAQTYRNQSQGNEHLFTSIHAWANNSQPGFYSPLPVTPQEAPSTPTSTHHTQMTPPSEIFSDGDEVSLPGQATPTDSASLADSGEEVWQPRSGATSEADFMSVDGGITTPDTWTEVGSLVSENDIGVQH